MRTPLGVLAVAASLALPSSANAALGMWGLSEDGQPRLDRTAFADPVDFFACPPGGAPCTPVAGAGPAYEPGETAEGTVFEARFASGHVDRSPVWQGAIGPQSPPAVDGSAIEGGVVQPVAGEWSGGWADDTSALVLVICRSREGEDCGYLPAAGAGAPVPVSGDGPALIPAGSAGGHLFAVEWRVARDALTQPAPLLYAPDQRFTLPLPGARTVVSLPLGPVAPVGGTPPPSQTETTAPAVKPSVKLRAKAYRRKGRVVVGTVTCRVRCKVRLTVGKVRRDFSVRGTKRLEVVRGKRVKPGRLKVTVRVDGIPLKTARVRLSRP